MHYPPHFFHSTFLFALISFHMCLYSILVPNDHNAATEHLKHALKKRNIEKVEQALHEGADIHESSLLHEAFITRVKKIVKLMLDHGVVINTFYPTLTAADIYGDAEILGKSTYTGPGNTLTVALFLRDLSLIHLLLRYGATINQEDPSLKTYEYSLVKKLAKSLGAEGMFILVLVNDDPTALHEFFTQSAANTTQTNPEHKQTKLKRFKNLLKQPKKPYTINTPNRYGKIPLMLAAVAGKERIVLFLLHAHVNAELKDSQGNTAYMLARQQGNIRIAEFIKSYILFYKKLMFVKHFTQKNNIGLPQDIVEHIADYVITLD